MALDMVRFEGLGSKCAVARYFGTMSFLLQAATNLPIGTPILLANIPALRLPKLPLGTEKTSFLLDLANREYA